MIGTGQIAGIAFGAATLICFLNIITVCCILNHPDKKNKGSNFYTKMMEV